MPSLELSRDLREKEWQTLLVMTFKDLVAPKGAVCDMSVGSVV